MDDDDKWEAVLDKEWYVVPNDLIGGWVVSTIDLPMGGQEDWPLAYVADFTTRQAAKHIVRLHNEWLTR